MSRRFFQTLCGRLLRRWSLVLPVLLAGCGKPPPAPVDYLPANKITVIVTTTHLAELARQVGGDAVSVRCLVTPDVPAPKPARLEDVKDAVLEEAAAADAESEAPVSDAAEAPGDESPPPAEEPPWNPNPFQHSFTASDFFAMRTARVVVAIGLGLEKGLEAELPKLEEAGVRTVLIGKELPPEDILINASGQPDPCIWNSGRLWLRAVDIMGEALQSAVPPEAAPYFENRAHALKEVVGRTVKWAQERLTSPPAGQRFILASHDSLRYFARDFGIQVRAIFAPDGQPLPVEETELLSWLDAHGVNDFLADAAVAPLVADELCNRLRILRSNPTHTLMLAKPGTRQLGRVEALDMSTWDGAYRGLIRSVERRMGGGKRISDGETPPPESPPEPPAENPDKPPQ